MKKIILGTLFICTIFLTFAQGSYEAFRFSQIDHIGTARYMGICGAFSSIGGDFTAISTNPAAIGIYKRNEVSFTPLSISFAKDQTIYNGNISYTQNPKYSVPQCGLVIASAISDSYWKNWQFGFGYNRVMDFNNIFRLQGPNNNTFINPIIDNANGTYFGNLTGDEMLAWNTWLIDTIAGNDSRYFSPFQNKDIEQTAVVKQSGAIDEITLSFGGNYNDKLYLGATIGIPILEYKEETILEESPLDGGNFQGISSYKVSTEQNDRGAGVNARIGLIYQPVSFLRLSAAVHTPTDYTKISDTYSRTMTSYWANNTNNQSYSYTNAYRFALSTPFKFNVGAGFLIKRRAFISAEYEFYDYSMATLFANDYSFDHENRDIHDLYKTCHTVRIGGEVNLTSKIMLRAGYAFKSSPYRLLSENSEIADANAIAQYGSLGFGYHSKYFFFDIAYVLRYTKDNYTLFDVYTYNADNLYSNTATIKNTTHRIVATFGCKF